MAGQTPSEALHNFLDPLKRAVSCVLVGKINHTGAPTDQDGRLVLDQELSGTGGTRLSMAQSYRIVQTEDQERGPWKARTRAYTYTLESGQGPEMVAFHWHPEGRSLVTRPHMHLGPGCGVDPDVSKIHFPTGRVSVEDFIWVTIEGFGIESRRGDWQDILAESRGVFEQWRTWS